MAYCRWSDECDVYVYESNEGWECHLANRRRRPWLGWLGWLCGQVCKIMLAIARLEYSTIKLKNAGASFQFVSPGECAFMLRRFRARGYLVPQYAIDDLIKEQDDIDKEAADEAGYVDLPEATW